MNASQELQLAVRHHQAGRLDEAESLYRRVLVGEPTNADAMNLLGMVFIQKRQFEAGRQCINKAIVLSPARAEFHFNLGLALAALNKPALAATAFRQAAALEPRNAAAWSRLADALIEINQPSEAEAASRKALELRIDLPEAHNALGKALYARGELDAAAASFHQAVALHPQYPEACNSLGQSVCELGDCRQGRVWCERAVRMQPDYALAHWNLGLMQLRLGEWEQGWQGFEWRWRAGKLSMVNPYPHPLWDGGELGGKRILLHAEQGFGDTIQFLRYVPLVAQRGGIVMAAVQKELLPLARGCLGAERWVVPGDSLPPFDLQCPLPSLPGRFRTTLADVPAAVPYLRADPDRVEKWRRRMEAMGRPRVGLAWTGSKLNPNDRNRSFPLAALAPLGKAAGAAEAAEAGMAASFVSLQKGEERARPGEAPMALADWTDELNDFADTAALVENLDLVITADTVVAHLAGAMGKPVWIILQLMPDWRWLLDRADSPWYPTARLFRQERRGDWTSPIEAAAEALKKWS
jgi:Flp pilus assembly protein TadD